MSLAKEFITSKSNSPWGAEDEEEEQHGHGDDAPDHIQLFDPLCADTWLRLIQSRFYNGPAERVKSALDEDDAAGPAVQKVEVLVGYAGEQGQKRFSHAEQDRERRQCEGEGANTVGPAAYAGSCRWEARAFERDDPG